MKYAPTRRHTDFPLHLIRRKKMSTYWKSLLPAMSANASYKIASYGAVLRSNKAQLILAFVASKITDERRALMTAMAMIETNTMSPSERDASKDKNTDKSANASIFNLSEDMLNQLGYTGNIHLLDPLPALPDVVRIIDKGINTWSVTPMLNFVRGGRTAFKDGVSYGVSDYRNAVATILKVFDSDNSLLGDERRVEIYVKHV
jgi:hypothetical protein